jgi:hypothetical protein
MGVRRQSTATVVVAALVSAAVGGCTTDATSGPKVPAASRTSDGTKAVTVIDAHLSPAGQAAAMEEALNSGSKIVVSVALGYELRVPQPPASPHPGSSHLKQPFVLGRHVYGYSTVDGYLTVQIHVWRSRQRLRAMPVLIDQPQTHPTIDVRTVSLDSDAMGASLPSIDRGWRGDTSWGGVVGTIWGH